MKFTYYFKKNHLIIFLVCLVLATISTCIAYYQIGYPLVGIDDANIFFVYAKNIAQGHGFVYNIGGERVEGFTSLLWVLICSIAFYVSDHAEFWLVVFNILLISSSLTALLVFADTLFNAFSFTHQEKIPNLSTNALILLLWIFAVPGYIYWTTLTLMESGLWSALIIWGTIISVGFFRKDATMFSRRVLWLTLLIFLILLTRPEGMLWALLFVFIPFGESFRATYSLKRSLRLLTLPLLTYLATIILLTLFRLWYFGYPLPNTYYAKISPDILFHLNDGTKYFQAFISSNPLIGICLVLTLTVLAVNLLSVVAQKTQDSFDEVSERIRAIQIVLIILAGITIPIYSGGDLFQLFRFYQPIWPLLILPCYAFVMHCRKSIIIHVQNTHLLRKFKYVLFFCLLILFSLSNSATWFNFVESVDYEFKIAYNQRIIGEFLNFIFKEYPLPSVGVINSGGIAYTYNGEIIDLVGLNSTAMAHSEGDRKAMKAHAAFDKDVFFTLKPDLLIIFSYVSSTMAVIEDLEHYSLDRERNWYDDWLDTVLKGLLEDQNFMHQYTRAIIGKPDVTPYSMFGYFKNEYLTYLSHNGFTIKTYNW